MDYSEIIEDLLEKPFWLIDILPAQVPETRGAQYFEAEKYFLEEPQKSAIHQQFVNLLVKLGCYHDLVVVDVDGHCVDGPLPDTLVRLFASDEPFFVLLDGDAAMVGYTGEDHLMTLYNPSPPLLPLLSALTAASGLFLWQHATKD